MTVYIKKRYRKYNYQQHAINMYHLSLLFLMVNCSCQKSTLNSIGAVRRAYNPLTHRINWPLALSTFGSTFDSIKNSLVYFYRLPFMTKAPP